MTPEQEYVLNTIAAGESPSYDTLYGGHRFKSYASHPAIPIPVGDTGKTSTAAGRYQLLKKTWDNQAAELGLKDFSPESQDAAAWNLAQETYSKKTGRDLQADAREHQIEWSALADQWPSLKRFEAPVAAPQTVTGASPSMEPLILQQLPSGHSAIPVDFDPFQRNPSQ